MLTASRTKPGGFSIVELLVVILIVGILAVIATMSLLDSRARARDANRKSSVDSYSTAMEQWKAMSGHTYFVQASSTPPCNAKRDVGDGFMIGEMTSASCVGYMGGGAGRITRKGGAGLNYGKTSIAEALRSSGVLTTIRSDPSDNGDFTSKESGKDFILTVCDATGAAAKTPQTAVEFSIYASLEKEASSSDPASNGQQARHSCGGPDSGHGWTVEFSW